MIREADAVLDVLAARGILRVIFEQGRLAYFYDCSREVWVGTGYKAISKEVALRHWTIYMRNATPYEVNLSLHHRLQVSSLTCFLMALLTALHEPLFLPPQCCLAG